MSAPYSDLQSKAAAAFAAVIQAALTAAGDTTAVYPGFGTIVSEAIPRVVAHAERGGDEETLGTGNYMIEFTAEIVSAKDPDDGETAAQKLTQHNTLCGLVIDSFAIDGDSLTTALSTYADFTCLPGSIHGRTLPEQVGEERQLFTKCGFMGLCCPSTLSA